MVKKLYSYNLLSHPDVKLIEHLKFVGYRAAKLIEIKDIKFKYSKEELCNTAKVMGYCHDLGKSTSFFQQYLKDRIEEKDSKVDEKQKSHALISAIICYYNLKDINTELAIMTFLAIKHHHSNYKNFVEEIGIGEDEENKKLIREQYNALDNEIKVIANKLNLKLPTEEEILDIFEVIDDDLDYYNDELENNKDFQRYILFKFLFSVLIYADKEHAIFKKDNNITYDIPENLIGEYKLKKFGVPDRSNLRNIVYEDVLNSLNNNDKRIMSITLPTGSGKTYTCMAAALKIKKMLEEDMRIIYCLPFTSVIDQNFEDYKNAIKETMNLENVSSDKILKHHYLSPSNYEKADLYYDSDEARFLTQNWNSQIIVTTFIQLFTTLFSNENSSLIKYNTLANSIILLDEVQSIPYKYWKIINRLFIEMAERLNIYFILITATQPLIFEKSEISELASKSEEYFSSYKRTKLIVQEDPMNKEEFFKFAEKIILENQDKNILFITNTIKLSQELYKSLEELEDNRELEYLSTSIVPIERRNRIDKIKKSKRKMIVVSTQLVEAGVDIDMDIVIRDIAPLDSINQSAGRANRENRGKYLGEVYVVRIEENNRSLAKYVYSDILLKATKKVLNERDTILEEDYKTISDMYFKEVNKNKSNNKSNELIKDIYELEFEKVNDEFKLIDAQDKVQLFIEVNNIAKVVWNKYLEYKKIEDIKTRRDKLESIKVNFYNYVISVFKNKCKDPNNEQIGYISSYELENVYDEKFGYKLQEDSQIIL